MSESQRVKQSQPPSLDQDGAWTAVENFARTAEPLARAYTRTNSEMSSLVGRRVSAYATLPTVIRELRTPADLITAQLAFWTQARRDYLEASQAVLTVWQGLAASPSAGVEQGGTEQRPSRDVLTVRERDAEPDDRAHAGKEPRRAA